MSQSYLEKTCPRCGYTSRGMANCPHCRADLTRVSPNAVPGTFGPVSVGMPYGAQAVPAQPHPAFTRSPFDWVRTAVGIASISVGCLCLLIIGSCIAGGLALAGGGSDSFDVDNLYYSGSYLHGTITNTSSETFSGATVRVNFKDRAGTVHGSEILFIPGLAPNESYKLAERVAYYTGEPVIESIDGY